MRRYSGPVGRVEVVTHESEILRGNALGDPSDREIAVYLPAGYGEEPERRYPVLYDLAGYTGSGLKRISWSGFTENVPERLDRLIGSGAMSPAIVCFPDAFTSLGGNQYIDTSAIGPWGSYLTTELVPWIESRYAILPGRDHRGVYGKSSGGYGAIIHGMKHADVWGAVACHSGDMYFLYGYLPDFPLLVDVLAEFDHSVSRFLESIATKPKHSGRDIHALMVIAMAATYDPDPSTALGYHLPVDLETGELKEERWQKWLAHDPVEIVEEHAEALRSLRALFIDCGSRDQYRLHHGARILHRKLETLGVPHVYEEFPDNHSSLDYRLDESLPRLAKVLSTKP